MIDVSFLNQIGRFELVMKKDNSNKNLIILVFLAFIFIIAVFTVYSRYMDSQELVSVKINRVTSEQLSSKALDLSVLNDSRFIKLKEINFNAPNIKSINIGNDSPFSREDNK